MDERLISEKQALRRLLLARRRSLSASVRAQQSEQIALRLIDLLAPLVSAVGERGSRTILSYLAQPDEVNLALVHDWCLRVGMRLLLPSVVSGVAGELRWFAVSEHSRYRAGAYGIAEPLFEPGVTECVDDYAAIDAVLLPGLGYDARGVRIGFGGGYYDRFVAQLEHRPLLIAPAFSIQMVAHVPRAEHDLSVDWIVTEERVMEAERAEQD